MSRKEFIESHGATCANWIWSWSYINEKDKVIIFGAWDRHTESNVSRILSERGQISAKGKKQPAYKQSREHIRLIKEEGYTLKTFPMVMSDDNRDEQGIGPAKIESFTPKLTTKKLSIRKSEDGEWTEWLAVDYVDEVSLPEEVKDEKQYHEGATKKISVNAYERNAEARKKCIEHYGYKCAVCAFDFEKIYGDIGKEYIHVHHVIPLAEIKQEYEVDPIKDLIPVCPNCHAMIHKAQPALTVKQLKKRIN